MNPVTISLISFVCVFGAALLGSLLKSFLPKEHLSQETRDAVKLCMGLVATMTALILGLLVASAKEAYDAKKDETTQMAAKISFLDRELTSYGTETSEARQLLREIVERMIVKLWSPSSAPDQPTGFRGEQLYLALQKLAPQNSLQDSLKTRALSDAVELGQTRWLLHEQAFSSISVPLLITVILWLAILFLSFALFAPRNATVVIALMLAALSVSGSILLILELDRPFDGFIQISSNPMRQLIVRLGQ